MNTSRWHHCHPSRNFARAVLFAATAILTGCQTAGVRSIPIALSHRTAPADLARGDDNLNAPNETERATLRSGTQPVSVLPASFQAEVPPSPDAVQLAPAPTDLLVPRDDAEANGSLDHVESPKFEPTDDTFGRPMPIARGISLAELQQMADANNPSIARANAAVRRLHGKWTQVGLRPNPTLGYLAAEVGNEGQAGQQGMFVGQSFVRGGKLQLNRDVVCREIEQAEQQLAAQYRRVANDVRRAFYDAIVAQQRQQLAQQLADVSERAVKTSESLLAAQEVSQVALLQSELQAQEVAILQRRATNTYNAAWRRLAAVVGMPSLEPQALASDEFETLGSLTWEENVQRILSEHPDVAGGIANVQRARAALARAVVEPISNVNVQLSVQYDDSTEDVVTGVQVGMPIPIWNRNQGGICEARAAVVEAERQLDTLELALQERLAEPFNRIASAQFELGRYADHILPRARRTMDLVTKAYAAGEVGYLEQLAAQRTFFQTNLAYLDSQQSYWQAMTEIDGLLLANSLQTQ